MKPPAPDRSRPPLTHLLAIDQGTSSSRTIIFDAAGRIEGTAQREIRQIYPKPGWVEHDPREIWATHAATIRLALARAGLNPSNLAGIGITNQRETTVLWDRRTSEPVANAIVWQDRRTAAYCDSLKAAGRGELIRRRTGADPKGSCSPYTFLSSSNHFLPGPPLRSSSPTCLLT